MKKVMKLVLGMMILGTVLVSCKTNADSHDHTYSEEWTSDGTGHWHKATCEHTDEVADKAEHTFGEWIVKKAATEEEKGSRERICSVCNYKQTEEIAKLDHVHAIGVKHDAVAATCTVDGNVEYYDCVKSGCTAKLDAEGKELSSVTVAATGHIENTGTVTTPPTCVVKGVRLCTCSVCGNERTEEIAALGWCETAIDAETYKKATDSSKYVYFGVFPQTVLPQTGEDLETVDESDSVTMGANVYYKGSKGNWYAKCSENACSNKSEFKYTDNSQAGMGGTTTRYFKVEPIKWKVLTTDYNNTGKALLFAEEILTAKVPYYKGNVNITRTVGNVAEINLNNYEYSQIRAYLNGLDYYYDNNSSAESIKKTDYTDKGFLQTAFTAAAQLKIAETTVDNSGDSTTDEGGNIEKADGTIIKSGTVEEGNAVYYPDNTSENTTDKIFLLSEKEVTTTAYGFGVYDSCGEGNARIRLPTDYAKANYNYVYKFSTTGCGGFWWLRSPIFDNKSNVRYIKYDGDTRITDSSDTRSFGIVPALTISFTQD